jgi:soluble lytic murein transglycosylase
LRAEIGIWLAAIAPRGPEAPAAAEIARLLRDHPDWPERGLLVRRLAEALADSPPNDAQKICDAAPVEPAALLVCAEADAATGQAHKAFALALRAYLEASLPAAAERQLRQDFGATFFAADHWARFVHLAWGGSVSGALEMIPQLTGEARIAAQAWQKLHDTDAGAAPLLAMLTPDGPFRNAPLIRFEEARAARREGDLSGAAHLWANETGEAEQRVAADYANVFASERDIAARLLIANHDWANAESAANDSAALGPAVAECQALRGLIAFDRGDFAAAVTYFRDMAAQSPGIVNQARALWWQGMALSRNGDAAAAAKAFKAAAKYPTNFFGQAAILSSTHGDLVEALARLHDPAPDPVTVNSELVMAAGILASLEQPHHAAAFLQKAAAYAQSPGAFAALAAAAKSLNLPNEQVQIARAAGRQGVVLRDTGWPEPYRPPPGKLPAALLLGVMRQESSFDPDIVSAARAVGLMQLLPTTAAEIAHADKGGVSAETLTEPMTNMRLGTAYLAHLIDGFDGAVPYAIAAYNAGPHRVHEWLADNSAPPADMTALALWIEHIPAAETRSYVPRVIEGAFIYNGGKPIKLGLGKE